MRQDIAEKWVTALRSGDYTQGKGYLQINGKYCCLGVLCEIAAKEGIVVREDNYTSMYVSAVDENDLSEISLPRAVKNWADMDSICGAFPDGSTDGFPGNPLSLDGANDMHEWDFETIANFIEKNYAEL